MDSRADMRNVTTILLSEDSSSSAGSVDIATWAMIPAQETHEKVNMGRHPQGSITVCVTLQLYVCFMFTASYFL